MEEPRQDHTETERVSTEELSDFEFTLITFFYGFMRWVEKCMEASDTRGLKALDILVLHAIHQRTRGYSPNQIATTLNIDDVHLVSYSIKKLAAAGLILSTREGRHQGYETTQEGADACGAYMKIRESYLLSSLWLLRENERDINHATKSLRVLTGMYDQAGRFAIADAVKTGRPQSPPVRTKR